jgi:hypothetical protein
MKIAILGAQGTGKSQLAQRLRSLQEVGTVITDAPPLMAAIHGGLRYRDQTLCDAALAQHERYDLTLVTGLDIACNSGQAQYEGSASRETVDARLRAMLTRAGIAYAVVYGQGPARVEAALKIISAWRGKRLEPQAAAISRRQWTCEKCSDPECEHRLFTGQLGIGHR